MAGKVAESKPLPQAQKFRDLARELECDTDEAVFKAKLVKIARARPLGTWQVRDAKVGTGYYPHLTPTKYGAEDRGPVFDTPEEAQAWIDEQERLRR